jgi:hypothetical protein
LTAEPPPTPPVEAAEAVELVPAPAEPTVLTPEELQARWADVVEHVTARKRMLGVLMSSAQPLAIEENGERLVVGFGTSFNLKKAELAANRQAIEEGVRHVLGRHYRLRYTLTEGRLEDDPVISYAVQKFGGRPRRVGSDEAVSS